MATIVIEEEQLAPSGFRFTAYEDGSEAQPGVGATRGEAVAAFLAKLPVHDLEEARWAAATWGDSSVWLPLMVAELAERGRT